MSMTTKDGDQIEVDFQVGAPETLTEAGLPSSMPYCVAYGYDDRAMVIPIVATTTLKSSLALSNVTLDFGSLYGHNGDPMAFIGEYSSGNSCSGDRARVAWDNPLRPNQPKSFKGYYVISKAITPRAPEGDPSRLRGWRFRPTVYLVGDRGSGTLSGERVVRCDGTTSFVETTEGYIDIGLAPHSCS